MQRIFCSVPSCSSRPPSDPSASPAATPATASVDDNDTPAHFPSVGTAINDVIRWLQLLSDNMVAFKDEGADLLRRLFTLKQPKIRQQLAANCLRQHGQQS